MRDLKKIVDEYLSNPTDYAIQIVGNWGHGKTNYYKKHLENLINSKEVFNDARKKYKPIYISLFGLKSTEEIATKVVIEFYESKFFKNYYANNEKRKKLRITEGILKIGFRGFLAFTKFGDINEYTTDIRNIGNDVLATDELVLCFDDLERKDSALNVKDLTGYINNLLDEKVKVLLISNEDILKKEVSDYKDLKEKIIGITVDYSVNIKSTIEEIIETKFSSSPEFQKQLKKDIDLLIEISESAENNFRHVIYALNVLHQFFGVFRKNIFDTKHEITEKLKEEFSNISRIILAFAIEYKASNLTNKDLGYYNNAFNLYDLDLSPKSDLSLEENKNSKLSLFVEKYKISRDQYLFYETIFNYVSFGDEFNVDEFIIDFKNKFHLYNGEVLPQYQLTNDLGLNNYFILSDAECLEKFDKIFEYVDEGLYKPDDYLSIVFLTERFKDIFAVDLDKAFERLVNGLKISIQNTESNSEGLFSQFKGIEKSTLYSELQGRLYDIGVEEIKLYNKAKQQKRLEEIIHLFLSDYKQFHFRSITENDLQYDISRFSFLNNISDQDFLDNVKRNDNGLILFLQNFFKKRYNNMLQFEEESTSIDTFFINLNIYSEELNVMEDNRVRKYLINELIKTLAEIMAKFKKEELVPIVFQKENN